MTKRIFHQNGFTRTSLSATVTRVSNFVVENVFLLHRPVHSVTQTHCPTRQKCQSQCTQHVQSIECFTFYYIPR